MNSSIWQHWLTDIRSRIFSVGLSVMNRIDRRAYCELIQCGAFGTARSVLEVGGGLGTLAELVMKAEPDATISYTMTEVDSFLARRCRLRFRRCNNIRVVHVSASHSYPFPDAQFDRVIATFVLDTLHTDELRVHLDEISRVAAPGCLLVLLSIARGRGTFARLVSIVWSAIYQINPDLVWRGTAIAMAEKVGPPCWSIRKSGILCCLGFASELLIAERCSKQTP
jgi:ubiquinone/menaquinone biosynthesis C-methylase UbiE